MPPELRLPASRIEIRRIESGVHGSANSRPLRVKDLVPRGIAVSDFDDHVVEPDALEAKIETPRGCATLLVERIATPLHSPVAANQMPRGARLSMS